MLSDPPLRPATQADVPAIRALVRAAYARWIPLLDGREPKPMRADYAHAVRTHRIDLLFREGVLAALIETAPRADHLWIENVAVAPAFQGRGLGHRLLAHAEALATAARLPELRLLTNAVMAPNIALYLSVGYAITRREDFALGVAVHMSKRLAR